MKKIFFCIVFFYATALSAQSLPELMYFKFNGSGTTPVPNEASSPVGNNPAPVLGGLSQGSGGQFGNGLIGAGTSSTSDYVNTGWATNISGSWTISLYLNNIPASTVLFYFFGDISAGTFRCFTNGVAGANNLMLRCTGLTDVLITNGASTTAPSVSHFVYDAVASQLKGYLNGTLVATVTQASAFSTSGAGPFKVGAYGSNSNLSGKMDEFRFYNRALSAAEIAGTWNQELSPIAAYSYTGTVQTYTVLPCVYSVSVDVKGAEGAPAAGPSLGGKGGRALATFSVTPGEVLNIYVGQKPALNSAGWNGGGTGASAGGGGGGGASDIRRGGTALSNRILVAGGGGGAGICGTNSGDDRGGNGGGLTGTDGWGCGIASGAEAGKGGTQTSGGAASPNAGGSTAGSLGNGGQGGTCVNCRGGGGGGGYYGGGGAGFGGAGGGSGFASSTIGTFTYTTGFQTGDGQITITPVVSTGPPTPGVITGPSSVCIGSTATYSISSVPAAATYTWTVPAGTVINSGPGTTTITVTFGSISGDITVKAGNSCGTSSPSTKAVTVNPNPTANAGTDVTICSGSSATLIGTGGVNYSWSTGETTDTIIMSPPASATYTLTVADINNCTASDEVTVTVDSCVTEVSSAARSIPNIIIVPNPTTGMFKVENSEFKIQSLEIYNVMGECIYNSLILNPKSLIDISSEPAGMYFLKMNTDSGSIMRKIVISNQ